MNEIENTIRHLKVGNFTGKQLDLAISALERQIPKKPILDKNDFWVCPLCKGGYIYPPNALNYHQDMEYCNECGQKLDWEVQE